MEIVIFVAFVAIQYAAKALPNALERGSRVHRCAQALSKNHFLVWLGHPAIVEGVHDYAIHFIVYSGYVIRAH